MKAEWLETLSLSVLFNGISKESLNIMLECLKPRIKHCRPREVIVAFGQPFHGIGIIAAGKVALTKETYSGNRIIMGIFGAGDIFGETVAFSEQQGLAGDRHRPGGQRFAFPAAG